MDINKIITGRCEEVLKTFPDNFFDSCVTDPPYGISFMNKHWDYAIPPVSTWQEVYRVLKPGAHILVACGTRTQHRMAVNIEDAGFEIRDVISWIYGQGFPKSLDISKAIDKLNGVEREVIAVKETKSGGMARVNKANKDQGFRPNNYNEHGNTFEVTAPATDAAKQYDGYGTALKPATEFWTLARKPISEDTIAANVLKHGTGGLNIDACRIPFANEDDQQSAVWGRGTDILSGNYVGAQHGNGKENIEANPKGRFPANVVLDEFAGKLLDEQSGQLTSGTLSGQIRSQANTYGTPTDDPHFFAGDSGGASRFFYCAKAGRSERNKGLEKFQIKPLLWSSGSKNAGSFQHENTNKTSQNNHPTVKPIELMRWLIKLITPQKGIVLDPFAGSGSTCIGAKLELMNYAGIEMNEDYCKIAEARIAAWNPER